MREYPLENETKSLGGVVEVEYGVEIFQRRAFITVISYHHNITSYLLSSIQIHTHTHSYAL